MQIYCLKCKQQVTPVNPKQVTTKTGRPRISASCPYCKGQISRMLPISKRKGKGIVNSALNFGLNHLTGIVPEMHLRTTLQQPMGTKYSFAGPFTRLNERLNPDKTWKDSSKPINRVDEGAYHHDLAYQRYKDIAMRTKADKALIEYIQSIEDPTPEERVAGLAIIKLFEQKNKRGMGIGGGDPEKSKQLATSIARFAESVDRERFDRYLLSKYKGANPQAEYAERVRMEKHLQNKYPRR